MVTEKVYLRDVSYKHAQLLWVDRENRLAYGLGVCFLSAYLGVSVGLLVICNVYIEMDSKTYETYHALHENIFVPSFSERDSTPLYRMTRILYGLTSARGQA